MVGREIITKTQGTMVTMIRKKKESKTKKKEGNGANTSITVDDDGGGGVGVFVSNALAHAFVSEVLFCTATVVVAIMRAMYDGVYINA